ncbi:MAG TPA: antibiotic biosynthesis monooxygenase family protein [Chloroflexota bacterium]|nr:antibiotic biosynthesis monooxygenase family protein [Chloroflexota bacterium]
MTTQGISFDHTVVGIVSFTVRPSEVEAWRNQWEPVAREAEATEGCLYFRLAQSTREDNGYAIVTAWNPGNQWLAFIQRVPALETMQHATFRSPFSFYVLMSEGEDLPWRTPGE